MIDFADFYTMKHTQKSDSTLLAMDSCAEVYKSAHSYFYGCVSQGVCVNGARTAFWNSTNDVMGQGQGQDPCCGPRLIIFLALSKKKKKKKRKRSNTTANNFQKSINLVISIRKACHWLFKNLNILLDWFHNQYCMNTPFKFYPWWSVLQGNCCSKTGISYSNDFIISTAWTHLLSFTLSGQRYRVTVVQKQEYPAGLIS